MAKDLTIVKKILEEYGEEVLDKTSLTLQELCDEGVAELRKVNMPSSTSAGTSNISKRRDWSKYSSGWQGQVEKKGTKAKMTIFNKKKGNQTSWLEFGHATKDGKMTRAFSHIAPVEEKLKKKFDELLKENLK